MQDLLVHVNEFIGNTTESNQMKNKIAKRQSGGKVINSL